MAQQIQGGGVTFDEGAGIRDAGNGIMQGGLQLMQQLTQRKNNALMAAEQSRMAFFDSAQKLGMTPQQYASTVGATDYVNMTKLQSDAQNADKLFAGLMKQGPTPQEQLQNFTDFNNQTPQALAAMSQANQFQRNVAGTGDAMLAQMQGAGQPPQGGQGTPVAPQAPQAPVAPQVSTAPQAPVAPPNLAQADANATAQWDRTQKTLTQNFVAPDGTSKTVVFNPLTVGKDRNKVAPALRYQQATSPGQASERLGAIMASKEWKDLPEEDKAYRMALYETALQRVSTQAGSKPYVVTVREGDKLTPKAFASKESALDELMYNKAFNDEVLGKVKAQTQTAQGTPTEINAPQSVPQNTPVEGRIADPAVDTAFRQFYNESVGADPTKRVALDASSKTSSTQVWRSLSDEKRAEWIEKSGAVLPPGVDLTSSPMAKKAFDNYAQKTNASMEIVTSKAQNLLAKYQSGAEVSDKDALTFKNSLAAAGGNYAKMLSSLDPKVAKAVNDAAIGQVMQMDSVQAQLAGMTDIASRKAAKEAIDANLEMVKLQMGAKLMGEQGARILDAQKFITDMEKIHADKMIPMVKQFGSEAAVYKNVPNMLDERNHINAYTDTFNKSTGVGGGAMDFKQLELAYKGFLGTGLGANSGVGKAFIQQTNPLAVPTTEEALRGRGQPVRSAEEQQVLSLF